MKDLYHRLGIDPNSSSEEVAAALVSKPALSECASILQDEQKRAGYDQAHATLNAIGILRHRLGLDSFESWFLENCPDFAPRQLKAEHSSEVRQHAVHKSETASYNPPDQQENPKLQTSTGTNQSYLVIVVVIVALLAILAYVFL
jgi:DnaJ-class molecular chaperone